MTKGRPTGISMEKAANGILYPRGAEWRKWDLHVHSPASHNFGGDWPAFVIQLGNSDCAVIGINDYFSVAGYKQLLTKLAERADEIEDGRDHPDRRPPHKLDRGCDRFQPCRPKAAVECPF